MATVWFKLNTLCRVLDVCANCCFDQSIETKRRRTTVVLSVRKEKLISSYFCLACSSLLVIKQLEWTMKSIWRVLVSVPCTSAQWDWYRSRLCRAWPLGQLGTRGGKSGIMSRRVAWRALGHHWTIEHHQPDLGGNTWRGCTWVTSTFTNVLMSL